MPLPIPRLAPVTTATLPVSAPMELLTFADWSFCGRLLDAGGCRGPVGEDHARHVARVAPFLQHRLEIIPAQAPAAEQEPFGLLVAFVGEIARRAFGEHDREVQRDFAEAAD